MHHAEVGFDQLKCDITLLPNSQDGTRAILLINFNLPKLVVEDRQVELPQRLGQIVNFLTEHFATETIYYQISSSYWIQNGIPETSDAGWVVFLQKTLRLLRLVVQLF